MDHTKAKSEATRVTVVGMVLDIVLGFAKIFGGMFTQSFALITDGIHSLTDAFTDIFVLVITRISHDDPDAEHPYGHGRFETLGTIVMGMVFFATAGVILYDSYQRLQSTATIPVPALSGLLLAGLSIAGKEWIYHYTMRVARRLNSSLLKANAWHSRSDAITSIAVFIGILAAQQGLVWMDTVAAIFVALIIAKIGFELCLDSLRELVDTAVPPERQEQIRQCTRQVAGVKDITALRSRLSGGKMILELHILVSPRISVSEGHQLGQLVNKALLGRFSDVGDVIVHIDPEDIGEHSEDKREVLPEREVVLQTIRAHWHSLLDEEDIQRVSLHYLEHGIEIELLVRFNVMPDGLAKRLEHALADLDYVSGLKIYNSLYEARLRHPLSS